MGHMGEAPACVSVAQAQDISCHMMSLQGSKVMHQGSYALITEEPDALIGHVRIRGGPAGNRWFYPETKLLPVA